LLAGKSTVKSLSLSACLTSDCKEQVVAAMHTACPG